MCFSAAVVLYVASDVTAENINMLLKTIRSPLLTSTSPFASQDKQISFTSDLFSPPLEIPPISCFPFCLL